MAEATFMSHHSNKLRDVLISKTVNPEYKQVVSTYARFNGLNYIEIDEKDGITDLLDLEDKFSDQTTCVILQVPNYY
jgi:glycine dehydrogenase subunit 1